ncbi:MAG: serine hydrolase domain-containing protein [Desulfocapsaceae bacterium]
MSTYREDTFTDCFINVGTAGINDEHEVDKKTVFDLASLTKPFVTLPAVLHLIDQGKISWDEPLDSLLDTSLDDRYSQVDLHSLLCHCSGFTPHRNYWKSLKSMEESQKKQWLLDYIIDEGLQYETGRGHLYSDVGYILLGYVVENKSGIGLDHYWRDNIAEPAGVEETLFFSTQADKKNLRGWVQTGHCRWTRRPLIGLVHDDNCRALGGVAGHAGLFGSSEGVLRLCKEYLNIYHNRQSRLPISVETFKRAFTQVGESEWSCGFNLPSPAGSSSGRYFSKKSLGHLGFTGVSFWIDVDKQLLVSLLTNRVRMGVDATGIKEARPVLHDLVVRCLESKK